MDETSDTLQPQLVLLRIESGLFDKWIKIKNTSCFIPATLFCLVIAMNMNMFNPYPANVDDMASSYQC